MPAALQVRLRASCLKWRPNERGLRQTRTIAQFRDAGPTEEQRQKIKPVRGTAQDSTTPLSLSEDHSARPASGKSLLEELFPEEAQRSYERPQPKRERDVPRLDVRATLPDHPRQKRNRGRERDTRWDLDDTTKTEENWWNSENLNNATPRAPIDKAKQEVMGVLMLRNASKTLVEDDFTRLIPQGLHIEGWQLEQAHILKVIPGRDTSTLERMNFYLILFSSRASMNAYRIHVRRLHELASKHIQSSLTSPIPPPPGYRVQGQDVDALLQSYTLVPPSQHLHLLPLPNELSPSVSAVVRHRGYPDIVKGPLKKPFIVMLRLEGPQLPLHSLKAMLIRTEKRRGTPWDSIMGELNCSLWVPGGKNISPMDQKSKLNEDQDGDGDGDGDENIVRSKEKETDKEVKRPRRKPKSAYLIGFNSEDKAQSFVRYWHRRPAELRKYTDEDDEIAPVVQAEVLW